MGYRGALEAAGAEVLAYQTFGSYQGDWWAKVRFEGKLYWVHGSYGSCSGCDAYQATFSYRDEEGRCEEHEYTHGDENVGCAACEAKVADYKQRYEEFGLGYLLRNEHTQEEAEAAARYHDWDEERVNEELQFLQANSL